MAYLIGIPLLIVLAILQTTVLADIHFFDGRPDIILLVVIGWSLAGADRQAMVWGLVGGLLLDSFSGQPFGSTAVSLVLIAYLVSLYSGRVWEANLLMPLGITLAASVLFHVVALVWLLAIGRGVELQFAFTRVILPSTILNLMLILPTAQLLNGLYHRLYPPEIEI
jgi:rod shape-determining protein MreD